MSTAALHGGFASGPRLRLTKRGRSVFTALAAIPLALAAFAFAINGGGAVAGAEGGQPLETVVVQPGESLWQLAESIAPSADPRDVIHEVMKLNGMTAPDVFAGQELDIPSAYSR